MNFPELICRVAKMRFDDEAQIGVRASPIAIEAPEAEALADAAKEILGPSAFVAIACPNVQPREDERLCLSAGERAAERATYWRNHIAAAEGERILYVSARRLGRAGGLQDTLFELSERRLREGFLEWCRSDASGCPPTLADALNESPVVERADARALAAFAEAVFGQDDPLAAAGRELPLLSLARDSRLGDGPQERLTANVRWVRGAAAGDTRGLGKLPPAAAKVRQALADAALGYGAADDLTAALEEIDLGVLQQADLDRDVPKQRPRKQKRAPGPAKPKASAAPKRAAPAASPPASDAGAAKRAEQSKPAEEASAERPAEPEGRDVRAPDGPKRSTPAEATEGAAEAGLDERAAPPGPPDGSAAPAEEGGGERHAPAEPAPKARKRSAPPPSGPPGAKPPAARRVRLASGGPWTQAMHVAELGPPLEIPSGVRDLLLRSMGSRPASLSWTVRDDDPTRVLVKLPRGLGEPTESAEPPEALQGAVAAWREARAALLEALGTPEQALTGLVYLPYTILGAPEVSALAATACSAGAALLAAATERGAEAISWVLRLDTVTVSSVSGAAACALAPIHPLPLSQQLSRVPTAAAAAKANGTRRTLLAAALDRPLAAPSAWPGPSRVALTPSAPAPRVIGFATSPRALSWEAVEALSGAVTQRFLELTPYASLGMRVAVDADDPDAAIAGVCAALEGADPSARFWIHVGRPVLASDLVGALVDEGRVTLRPPPTPDEPPHISLRIRHGSSPSVAADPALSPFIDAAGLALGRPGVRQTSIGAGSIPLADFEGTVSGGESWEAIIAPAITGAARRGASVLMRESQPGAELVVLTKDLRSASRELEPALCRVGVENTQPRTIRSLVQNLASGSAGVISLDGGNERQLAAQLLEHALFEHLGDDAAVASIGPSDERRWLGETSEDWGTFGVGVIRRSGTLQFCLGYSAVAGASPAPEVASRLARAAEIVAMLDKEPTRAAALALLEELLGRGTRQVQEAGPSPLETVTSEPMPVEISYLCIVPGDHEWAAGGRVGDSTVEGQVVDVRLLERMAMAAGRRRS